MAKEKKNIYMYDMQGNFKRKFASQTDASTTMGVGLSLISRASRGLRFSAGGYRWTDEFIEELEEIDDTPVYEKEFHQYKMTGEYVTSYNNYKELLDGKVNPKTLRNSLHKCLTGQKKSYNGYQWSAEKVENIGQINAYKRVAQYDKDDNLIAIHDSALSAVKSMGLSDSCRLSLFHAIRKEGKAKTYKGYRWEYVDKTLV